MKSFFKNLTGKPSTVSWLSFALLSLIVAGLGVSSTTIIFNHLNKQLMGHGIEHNQEIASTLIKKIENSVQNGSIDLVKALSRAIEDYNSVGFRLFVINRSNNQIIVDTGNPDSIPQPLANSWLGQAMRVEDKDSALKQGTGAFRTENNNQAMLIWLQEMNISGSDRWVLGVAKNQKALSNFTDDLYLYFEGVLLFTFILITLLGYFAMRSTGRLYERRLEAQVLERTLALNKAHEEALLRTRLVTIGKTATVLTHEMRNPLASIKLALSGLERSASLNERENKRVDMVLKEVDRLDSLLSETLDYVRPVKLSNQPLDFNQLLTTVLKQQAPVIEQKNIHLIFEGCSDCTLLKMDSAQIYQVLLNLIKNAIEASPQGGEITIELQCIKDVISLEISNQGELLSMETMRHAFEPFFT
ncbi:MAG: hypothetical protein KAU21_14580, partial [Gammaproteobacteria bacterium]|nr:hypothetical protein [Gammaproteobacteria bacterium]